MPYEWTGSDAGSETLRVWPHQSLPPKGFVTFIGLTAALFLLPLLAVLGTPILWGILPFIGATLWLTWAMIQRSYKDGRLIEVLSLSKEEMRLVRTNPRGPKQCWEANPYWVDVEMRATGGPVENYIIIKGAGRQVEIGAFLSPEEREALYADLQSRLNTTRGR